MARDGDEALGGHKPLGLDFDAGKEMPDRFDVAVSRSIAPAADQGQLRPEVTGHLLHRQTGFEDPDDLGRTLRGDPRQHVRWRRQPIYRQSRLLFRGRVLFWRR